MVKLKVSSPTRRARLVVSRIICRRKYHDDSYGYREARPFTMPDCETTASTSSPLTLNVLFVDSSEQLLNRIRNAPLLRYVDSLRTHGHRAARIDPLDLLQREEVAALRPERYGLSDPKATYDINGILWTTPVGSSSEAATPWTLEAITRRLREIYVGNIAYEYMHSPSKTERLWFSHLLESESAPDLIKLKPKDKKRIHGLLARSETMDQFLQLKFPSLKRYGLEGGESMLPALDALFGAAARAGVEHIVLGMPHRGRLNLLTDLLGMPPAALFHKLQGGSEIPAGFDALGDVVSHLTASPTLRYDEADKPLKVTLLPNPSHLEAVNPVALGKTRAKQFSLLKKLTREGIPSADCRLGDRVMCVQLHGDASFTGQGVVMEGLGLSNLPHFTVGGSVHIVVNNSIGYTTPASSARSSLYCSDIGKMINAPVLHVNGDYPEDVARAVEIAFKYRNYFRKDVIIDLIVYRRWGHNELDEPAFTQPLMYKKIRSRRSVPTLYEEQLIAERVLDASEAESVRTGYKSSLAVELAQSNGYVPRNTTLKAQWSSCVWSGSDDAVHEPETGVERDVLVKVGKASVEVPEGFEIHPRLQRHVKHRLESLESGNGLDFATAEALAFGSLMLEGNDVRISGQDVGRGTFSQRHAMLVDQRTEGVTVPLNVSLGSEGTLELANSSLSENAVLGFEYGVSWERPNILPIWEAQFGDFFNGAQVMIDTFISSAETKWLKQSGIVLLLPHGLDGAGPEHSSSRIERMLQLTNDAYELRDVPPSHLNMHVVYPTTPAQYFHLLRRQIQRNFRKPLIVASPKGLLRSPAASSSLEALAPGTKFQPVLDDSSVDSEKVVHIICLIGKLYYDLVKERQIQGRDDDVAIIRIEELAPFPFRSLTDVLGKYKNALRVTWVQEEPLNQGAWGHVERRINNVLKALHMDPVLYCGRTESAIPAPELSARLHAAKQRMIVECAFTG